RDAAGVMQEIRDCRAQKPGYYIRVNAFDATHGVESMALSFIVNRPDSEPGFHLTRTEGAGRMQRYSIESYAVRNAPEGQRYESTT
ncbi:MAG: ribulose bisphosphate carboxylase small subunit, partial [Actinomycetia bacterium]|nr:ribulose bisphosphate carboxylase small subunit [Actinomycetes bacterium]